MKRFFKKSWWLLPLFLSACHLETRLNEGNAVQILSESEVRRCAYIGTIFGYSVDEFRNSTEEQMKTSALNSLKNTAAAREANAVVITKHQPNMAKNASIWRYTIHANAYLCQ